MPQQSEGQDECACGSDGSRAGAPVGMGQEISELPPGLQGPPAGEEYGEDGSRPNHSAGKEVPHGGQPVPLRPGSGDRESTAERLEVPWTKMLEDCDAVRPHATRQTDDSAWAPPTRSQQVNTAVAHLLKRVQK